MNVKTTLFTAALLLAIAVSSSSDPRTDELPPWNVVKMEKQLQGAMGGLTKVRLLAWHTDLVCPPSASQGMSSPHYEQHALIAAETVEREGRARQRVLMLVVPDEDGWVLDLCAHCKPRYLFLERQPRVEDLQEFIPPIWLESGLWGDKLVAFGVLEENWKEVFSTTLSLVFKSNKPMQPTCEDARG